MNKDEIADFLERYGSALSDADIETVTECWTIPALVLSGDGALAVSDSGQVETFFRQAIRWYRSQGQQSIKPEIEGITMLGQNVVSVDVTWIAFDEAGAEKSREHSHYILQTSDDGPIGIRVAFTGPA